MFIKIKQYDFFKRIGYQLNNTLIIIKYHLTAWKQKKSPKIQSET